MPIAITPMATAAKPGSRSQQQESVANVLQQRVEPAGAAVIAMRLLHLLDAAKIAARRRARVRRRQSGGQGVPFRQLQMRPHFVVELPVEPAASGQGEQALYERSKVHDFASRNLATSAVALSQFSTSTCSCFAPGFGQGVDLHLAVRLRDAPLRADPPGLLQADERRIDRALAQSHQALRHLLDSPCEAVAVHRPHRVQGLQDQKVQGAMRDVSFMCRHVDDRQLRRRRDRLGCCGGTRERVRTFSRHQPSKLITKTVLVI